MPIIKLHLSVGKFCNKPFCQFLVATDNSETCSVFETSLLMDRLEGLIHRCAECLSCEIEESKPKEIVAQRESEKFNVLADNIKKGDCMKIIVKGKEVDSDALVIAEMILRIMASVTFAINIEDFNHCLDSYNLGEDEEDLACIATIRKALNDYCYK